MNKVEFAIQNELDIMNKVELTGVICSLVYAIAIVLGIEEQEVREMYCIDFSENDIVLEEKIHNLYQMILELRKFKNEECMY